MTAHSTDLISMADIARLAGQRRATVGNWKARNSDFPTERGRNARGPLYDRAEVTDWLQRTNRLDEPLPPLDSIMLDQLLSTFGDTQDSQYIPTIVLMTLAILTVAPSQRIPLSELRVDERESASVLRGLVHEYLPFAEELIPWEYVDEDVVYDSINAAVVTQEESLAKIADVVVERYLPTFDGRSGEFLIPKSVRRLMIALARPDGLVYNPASGMGQLLIDADDTAASAAIDMPTRTTLLIGQENNQRVAVLSELNLTIHGVAAQILRSDAIFGPGLSELRANRVLCVPPWNQKLPNIESLADDPRWVWGEPGSNDGNAAWIQHCLHYLADGGRAVVVLPVGVLFESGRSGRIRQRIVKSGLLDAVISLPAGLFTASTHSRSAVLVFSRTHRAQPGILMIDLCDAGDRTTRSGVVLDPSVIEQTAQTYHDWINGDSPDVGPSAVAAYDDLAANDFVLDPGRYQPVAQDAPQLDVMASGAAKWRTSAADLMLKCRVADQRLDLQQPTFGPAGTAVGTHDSVRLSELTDVITITRGVPTKDTDPAGKMPVRSVADLRNNAPPRLYAGLDYIDVGVPLPGDALVAIEGGTVGESFAMGEDVDLFVPSQQVAVFHVRDSGKQQLDPWYLNAWLATEQAREQIRRLSRGAGVHRVPLKALWSLLLPLPPLAVQREIGERFQTFNTAIGCHRALAESLHELLSVNLNLAFAPLAEPSRPPVGFRSGEGD